MMPSADSEQEGSPSEPRSAVRAMVANVGLYQTFGAYLGSYEQAVERLFSAAQSGHEALDVIAPPLLFLMRHAIELGYKYTLWELHQMNGEPYDLERYGDHKLRQLHRALGAQHEKAVAKYDLPESESENFKEYYSRTEAGMSLFEEMDATSFTFRYPIDKKGALNLPREQTVDLQALKLAFDDAMILLRHTADVLGEYVDIHRWMEAEARENWY